MHSDTLNGSGGGVVPAGDLGLAEHTGAVPLTEDQLNLFSEGDDDAQELQEQKSLRRRDRDAASGGDADDGAGSDSGRRGRNGSELPGSADCDGRAGPDGGLLDAERAPGAGEQADLRDDQQGQVEPFWIARVPVTHLDRVLQMGGDAGLGRVIEQTADETPLQVYHKLAQGTQQLWTIAEGGEFVAAAVTQIEHRDLPRILVVKYLAGAGFEQWVQALHEQFLIFAREQKCEAVEAFGREGWRKTLRAMGWSKVAALYRVPVHG